MAQLKSLNVLGNIAVTGNIVANGKLDINKLNIPTSSNATTLGPGANGQVLKSNGTSIYWGTDNDTVTTVSFTRHVTTGVKLGTININGSATDIYSGSLPLSGGTVSGSITTSGDLITKQYIKINAWTGYGSGSADFWYDGNNKFVEIRNATNLKLAGSSVATQSWVSSNYLAINGNAVSATKATQDGSGNVITSTYLPKTTYEWNKEVAFGQTGLLYIGAFPMYDSNITVDIDSTTSTTYHATLVIATQNINTTGGGSLTATVYGDATNTIAPNIYIAYVSGSNNVRVYFQPQSWSKNLIHIRGVSLAGTPTNICSNISSLPSDATRKPTNALLSNYLPLTGGTLSGGITIKNSSNTTGIGYSVYNNIPLIVNTSLATNAQKLSFMGPQGGTITFTMPATSGTLALTSDIPTVTDTKVTQAYSTTNNSYPLLFSATAGVSSTSSRGETTTILNNNIYANPYSGRLHSKYLTCNRYIDCSYLIVKSGDGNNASFDGDAYESVSTTYWNDLIYISADDADGYTDEFYLNFPKKSGTLALTSDIPTVTDTKVTQAYSTATTYHPVLLTATSGITSTSNRGNTTTILTNNVYIKPSTGDLYTKGHLYPSKAVISNSYINGSYLIARSGDGNNTTFDEDAYASVSTTYWNDLIYISAEDEEGNADEFYLKFPAKSGTLALTNETMQVTDITTGNSTGTGFISVSKAGVYLIVFRMGTATDVYTSIISINTLGVEAYGTVSGASNSAGPYGVSCPHAYYNPWNKEIEIQTTGNSIGDVTYLKAKLLLEF